MRAKHGSLVSYGPTWASRPRALVGVKGVTRSSPATVAAASRDGASAGADRRRSRARITSPSIHRLFSREVVGVAINRTTRAPRSGMASCVSALPANRSVATGEARQPRRGRAGVQVASHRPRGRSLGGSTTPGTRPSGRRVAQSSRNWSEYSCSLPLALTAAYQFCGAASAVTGWVVEDVAVTAPSLSAHARQNHFAALTAWRRPHRHLHAVPGQGEVSVVAAMQNRAREGGRG